MTTPKVEPPKDEVRDKINALKRNDNMIFYTDTVKGRQTCRDDLWAISTEELDNLAATIKLQQEALLDRLLTELESFPHYDRSLFRDGYTDDPADRRDMLEADQVKTLVNKLRLEL